MFKKFIFLFTFLIVSSTASAWLTQIQAFNCDIDDSLLVTDAQIMIWNTVTQREIGISTANWALVKGLIGKDGPFKNFVLRADALRDFGDDGPEGIYLFRNQLIRALDRGDESWKGPSWNAFVEALSRPETRDNTTLITARLHSPAAIMAGLQVLKDRNLIADVPKLENVYPVGWSGLPVEFKGKDDAESKAKVMTYRLDKIEAIPVPQDATLVENREGTGLEKLHIWGFSDDDYGNFSKALAVLSAEVAKGRWPHVKIVLFYTGLNNPDQRPRAVVIMPDGTTRPTLMTEATRKEVLTKLKTPEEAKRDLEELIAQANRGPYLQSFLSLCGRFFKSLRY